MYGSTLLCSKGRKIHFCPVQRCDRFVAVTITSKKAAAGRQIVLTTGPLHCTTQATLRPSIVTQHAVENKEAAAGAHKHPAKCSQRRHRIPDTARSKSFASRSHDLCRLWPFSVRFLPSGGPQPAVRVRAAPQHAPPPPLCSVSAGFSRLPAAPSSECGCTENAPKTYPRCTEPAAAVDRWLAAEPATDRDQRLTRAPPPGHLVFSDPGRQSCQRSCQTFIGTERGAPVVGRRFTAGLNTGSASFTERKSG